MVCPDTSLEDPLPESEESKNIGLLELGGGKDEPPVPDLLSSVNALRARIVELTVSSEVMSRAAVLEERNRLAREIHDTLAQAFTGILLQLRVALRIALAEPEEAWGIIDYTTELAKEGLAEARRSVWALQPEALEYSNLADALDRSVIQTSKSTGAHIELQIHGTVRPVEPSAGKDLLHIAQEAMINALKHGKSRIVMVHLTFTEDRLILSIQDDGVGFEVKRKADGGGFGLTAMSQRAVRLAGHLVIVSVPGRGTEISVSLPISRTAHPQENV